MIYALKKFKEWSHKNLKHGFQVSLNDEKQGSQFRVFRTFKISFTSGNYISKEISSFSYLHNSITVEIQGDN